MDDDKKHKIVFILTTTVFATIYACLFSIPILHILHLLTYRRIVSVLILILLGLGCALYLLCIYDHPYWWWIVFGTFFVCSLVIIITNRTLFFYFGYKQRYNLSEINLELNYFKHFSITPLHLGKRFAHGILITKN